MSSLVARVARPPRSTPGAASSQDPTAGSGAGRRAENEAKREGGRAPCPWAVPANSFPVLTDVQPYYEIHMHGTPTHLGLWSTYGWPLDPRSGGSDSRLPGTR